MQAALQALQAHTGLDRVYVFADVPGRQGVALLAEALEQGTPGIRSLFGDRIYADAEFDTVIPTLRAGRVSTNKQVDTIVTARTKVGPLDAHLGPRACASGYRCPERRVV
jgi:GAF domain-containing protein